MYKKPQMMICEYVEWCTDKDCPYYKPHVCTHINTYFGRDSVQWCSEVKRWLKCVPYEEPSPKDKLIINIQESAKQDTKLGESIVSLLEETYGFVDWATRVAIKRLIKLVQPVEPSPAKEPVCDCLVQGFEGMGNHSINCSIFKAPQPEPMPLAIIPRGESSIYGEQAWYQGRTAQEEKIKEWLPAHDQIVASKAVKDFAEECIKTMPRVIQKKSEQYSQDEVEAFNTGGMVQWENDQAHLRAMAGGER